MRRIRQEFLNHAHIITVAAGFLLASLLFGEDGVWAWSIGLFSGLASLWVGGWAYRHGREDRVRKPRSRRVP